LKKLTKAAFLSGLVFPGIGQISLRRYGRGIALILLVLLAVAGIVGMATYTAYNIIQEELKYGMVSFEEIFKLAQKYSHGGNSYYYACLILIGLCWVYGIIDAIFFKEGNNGG